MTNLTQTPAAGNTRPKPQLSSPRTVVGVVNNRRCYLYEASEFRQPIVGEVYEMQGEYYRVDTDYHGLPCSRYATKLVVAAHKADRRWLGGVLKAAHETSEPWPGEVANRFREDW